MLSCGLAWFQKRRPRTVRQFSVFFVARAALDKGHQQEAPEEHAHARLTRYAERISPATALWCVCVCPMVSRKESRLLSAPLLKVRLLVA